MARTALIEDELRERIIADPEVILEDHDLMRALIAANEKALGTNIVDLRGIAMERLEARLDRLEDTHRSVIAAAYENLTGTNQIHRAILKMLDPAGFEEFLKNLGSEVADLLRVDCVRLVLETTQEAEDPTLRRLDDVLCIVEPGFVLTYMTGSRAGPIRDVTLRQSQPQSDTIYGDMSDYIRSEALMRLDLGSGRLPGMLVMGAEDPHHFKSSQGTDLLGFFSGVFERSMRRWLS